MKLSTQLLVVVGTLLVLFLLGYLSYVGRSLDAIFATLLFVLVRWPMLKNPPSWWRLKFDPAVFAGTFVIGSFAKGMGTGSESGDFTARVTCIAIACVLTVFLLIHDLSPRKTA